MLSIRLFGELDLRLGDERPAPLESARARSLLAYLLLHDDASQSRQRLAFLLWPDSTEGQARTNLRHVLHTLRQAMPELDSFLEVTPQTLRWRWDAAPGWLDVRAFDAALDRAAAAGMAEADALAALREAVGHYTGDLLEGCYDEWIVEPRERLRDRYISALRRATDLLAARSEHSEAVRFGRELLRCDRLDEETYRLLMRVHHAAGDRAGAARVYHECVSTLRRELGVEPSPATAREYTLLIESERAPDEEMPRRPRVVAATLVGRDDEWERLTTCWRDAEQGLARLVLVTGEPGIGKSRIVEELAAWAAHRGAAVAQAHSYPGEGDLGYGAVISWLRAADIASKLRAAAPGDRIHLSRLLPELGNASEERSPSARDDAEQRRLLFDAASRALEPAGRPTLLVADDAQWCDVQSLQLVHYLLRRQPDSPLLIVATLRREDIDDDHPVDTLARDLGMLDRATEIALPRLSRDATEELALDLGSGRLAAANVDALHAETEGNPLFIVETIVAGWGGPDDATLPPKLQAVIRSRLADLSDLAGMLLGTASAVGREFTAEILAGATGVGEVDLVRALDELWRRGVIREHGTHAYDFAHGKIRDVAYGSLSPATRRRNHLLIAKALLELYDHDVDSVSGEVARHYDRAGRVEDALTWYRRAALQAESRFANAEAIRLFDRTRSLVAALPEGPTRLLRELEVLSDMAIPLAVDEGLASRRLEEVQRRAVDVAAAVGRELAPALLRSIAMTKLCRADFTGASIVADSLQSSAMSSGDDVLLIESLYLSGIAAFWDGRFESARDLFEEVARKFRPDRRREHLLRFGHDPRIICVSRLANTLWFLGDTERARQTRDGALAEASELGHPFSRGVARVFAALLAVELGETDLYSLCVKWLSGDFAGDVWHDPTTGAFHGYAQVLEGDAHAGIARLRAVIDGRQATDQAPGQRALLMRLLLAAHETAGDAGGGLAAADEALSLGGTRIWEAEIRRLRGTFLRALDGPTAEIELELERAAEVARRQGAVGIARRIEHTRRDVEQQI